MRESCGSNALKNVGRLRFTQAAAIQSINSTLAGDRNAMPRKHASQVTCVDRLKLACTRDLTWYTASIYSPNITCTAPQIHLHVGTAQLQPKPATPTLS